MSGTQRFLAWGLLVVLVTPTSLRGADWPQWRGPNRDGVAPGVEFPGSLPATLKKVWQVEVGAGHSGAVVSGGLLVVLARQGENEVVLCLDAQSGRQIWRADCGEVAYEPQRAARKHGKGPFATPTLADGKAYTFGITGTLSCYDMAAGELLWRKDFKSDFKTTHPTWGAANSPLIDGDRCILSVGSRADGALAAFDKNSGKLLWKMTDDGAAFSSPIVADLAGRRQVVTLMYSSAVGVAAGTGTLLWKVPFVVKYEQNSVTPVVHGPLAVISGLQQGTVALRVAADGGKVAATEAWKNGDASMYLTSPVRHGDYLYGLATGGRGKLVCIALSDGVTAWSSPGGLGDYVSIVRAGDRLLVLTTKGDLLLAAAAPAGYKELGRASVSERPVWAHLAVAGGRLYVKDKSHLTCFELP